MRGSIRSRVALGAGGCAVAAAGLLTAFVLAGGAAAHFSGCHAAHTCPSDHHTYVWYDPSTGAGWDCAEPGASELDPALDTTVIVWEGLTYYCRAASEPPPTAPATTTTTSSTTTTTSTDTAATSTTATSSGGVVLPNPELTPGVYNRAVRQATIRRTICVAGWTRHIRPPVDYTNALKRTQMAEYGETGAPSAYEEDHFIPLELGGAPRDPRNLWPEPRPQARQSDPLETRLRRRVCRGAMTVSAARAAIRQFKDTHG